MKGAFKVGHILRIPGQLSSGHDQQLHLPRHSAQKLGLQGHFPDPQQLRLQNYGRRLQKLSQLRNPHPRELGGHELHWLKTKKRINLQKSSPLRLLKNRKQRETKPWFFAPRLIR